MTITTVTFETNLAAADEIVEALTTVLAEHNELDPPDHIVLLSALRSALRNAAEDARPAETLPDDKGNTIKVGDTVVVTHLDADRGTRAWMHRGVVVGFGRTRARVRFDNHNGEYTVGHECLRVVA